MAQQIHSGPLPAPQTLEAYAKIIPNGAERIMAMAEKEQEFRHELTKTINTRNINIESRGQIFGFILSVIIIGSGVYLTATDKQTTGLVAVIGGIAILVGAFYYSKKPKPQQQEKTEE